MDDQVEAAPERRHYKALSDALTQPLILSVPLYRMADPYLHLQTRLLPIDSKPLFFK